MNFYPFPFLLEEAAPAGPPGEEQNARKNFSEAIIKYDSELDSTTQTTERNEDSDDTQGHAERSILDLFKDVGPTENEVNYFDISKINDDVDQGVRNLWTPQVKPWILEDLSNNEKSILWNSKDGDGKTKTVGITFVVNSEGNVIWTNEETFRNNFATIISSNQESIRTLYYVIQAFLDEIGDEETVTTIFSQNNTINMSQQTWFYWRVEREFLLATPVVNIGTFIEKSITMNAMFDKFHQQLTEDIQTTLQRCSELYEMNNEQMQRIADSIEEEATRNVQQIELFTNESIEHAEEIKRQNDIVLSQCNTAMQEYAASITQSRTQVAEYKREVCEALQQIQAEASRRQEEYLVQLQEGRIEAGRLRGSLNFLKAKLEVAYAYSLMRGLRA